MFFTGMDMFEGDGAATTYQTLIKSDTDGRILAKTYAESGMTEREHILCTPITTRLAMAGINQWLLRLWLADYLV